MKYYWRAFVAILGGVPLRDFLDIMRRWTFSDASSEIDDKYILGEVEEQKDSRSPERDWDMFRQKKGDTYFKHHEQKAQQIGKAMALPEQRAKAFQGKVDAVQEDRANLLKGAPRTAPSLVLGALAMLGAAVAALTEIGCLGLFLREWLVPGKMHLQDKFLLGSASVMMFGGLTYMAHLLIESTPGPMRRLLSVLFVGICLLFGGYRAYTNVDGAAVITATLLLAIVTGIMPLITAKLLAVAWSLLCAYGDRKLPFDRLDAVGKHYGAMLHEETIRKAGMAGQIESMMGDIAAEYSEGPETEKNKREAGRGFRRWSEAELAKYELAFHFWGRWARLVPATAAAVGVLLLLALSSCAPLHAEPVNMVVVCDRSSSSGDGLACSEIAAANAAKAWAEKAAEEGDGHFELLVIGKGVGDAVVFLTEDVPPRFTPPFRKSKQKWIAGVHSKVSAAALPMVPNGSAIAEAVYRAATRLSGQNGQKLIVVMSDLRQVSQGKWNFERIVPKSEEFVAWVRQEVPLDLSGINPYLCGFHPSSPAGIPRVKISELESIKNIWRKTFEAWGVRDLRITEECLFNDSSQQ